MAVTISGKKAAPKKKGQQGKAYDKAAIIEQLCKWIESGETPSEACKHPGMPAYGSLWRWTNADPALDARVRAANATRLEGMVDSLLPGVENALKTAVKGTITPTHLLRQAELVRDTKMWLIEKGLREKYGKSADNTGDGVFILKNSPDKPKAEDQPEAVQPKAPVVTLVKVGGESA